MVKRSEHDGRRIGVVATETGVSVETLRYYERIGLLPRPARTEHGARRYGDEAVRRVVFIKQAQTLGLRLREVLDLVGASQRGARADCASVLALLTKHIEEIDLRTRELRALLRTLTGHRLRCEQALREACDTACPTLEALEEEADVKTRAPALAGTRTR